jgi:hypothetical protein
MSTSLDTIIDPRLEATRVLSTTGLRLEATGNSTSACILDKNSWLCQQYFNQVGETLYP